MKLFFIILPIALMVQVSLAGSQESFDEFQKGVESLYGVLKSLIPTSETMVKETLDKLPTTKEYETYREQLKNYLEEVTEYNNFKGLCMEKTLGIVTHFDKFEDRYEEEDAPAEAKEVLKLFNENGYEEMMQELKNWAEKYGKTEVKQHLTDPDTTNAIRMLPMALKVC